MATEDTGPGDVDHGDVGADVDPERLQAQLSRIQEAMGLEERYESATETWLFFGLLTALAAGVSQYVYTNELAWYWYWLVWFGGFGGSSMLYGRLKPGAADWGDQDGKPDISRIFLLVYLAFLPLVGLATQFAGELTYRAVSLLTLSVIVVLLGVAYLVLGNVLKAYYIRATDRYAFYAGGVLMVALGTVLPAFETYPWLVFGGVYLVYAVAAYLYLKR